jgi:protein NirF
MKRLCLLAFLATPLWAGLDDLTGTGDLGLVIERATGSLVLVDRSDRAALTRIEGLGDLSHASLTYSPDERFAFVFGRDGGLTKVDLLTRSVVARIVQAGNSIGGAISDDGRLVAVSNYEPGGMKVFDADTLDLVADIPAAGKTVGLVDIPGRRFAWTVWDTGEVFLGDFSGQRREESVRRRPDRRCPYLPGGSFRREGRDCLRPVGRKPQAAEIPHRLWQDG